MSSQTEQIPEREKVVTFKLQWLIHAGYSIGNAEFIAERDDIDWHLAVDVLPVALAKGLDEETIMGIFR